MNTIVTVNEVTYELEGQGQETINTFRNYLNAPKERIILVAFKDGDKILHPDYGERRKNKKYGK